jgi:parvulin-like peptidyl-prolyl isomerase
MKRLSFLLISSIYISSCSRVPSEEEPVVRVNGRNITVHEFKEAFSNLQPKDITLGGTARAETKNLVLKSLVRRAVVLTAAEKSNIVLSEAELEAGLKKFKQGYTSSSFEQSLLEQMVDAEEWKNRVRQNILIEKLFYSSAPKIQRPSVKEALQYYEEHPNLFRKEAEVVALHLVVAERKVADELRQKIKKNAKMFKPLAKEFSTGPEGQDDAVIRVTQGTLPPELDRPLFELKKGELSPVIQTGYGFHLIQVVDRTAAINLDFAEVKDSILETLISETRQKWLSDFEENLIRGAQIEYNRELIRRL